MVRIPGWLTETARPAHGPVPWTGMSFGALAVGVPLAAGLADGQPAKDVLAAPSGLIAAIADRVSPYLVRIRRTVFAGILGAGGLLLGAVISGHGWLAVAVMVMVAGVSALLSSVGATWSTAGMFLLVYAALGTGPTGALRPLWETVAWILAGVGWLLVPGWLLHPRAPEESRVAAVYRALAVNMRALGIGGVAATRQGRTLAEPRPVRERVTMWRPTVVALEWLLEAIPATAVNTAGQQPPAVAVSELSTALRRVATALRARFPVPPQPQLPRPPSLELVSDAMRSVWDTVARTPLKPPEPSLRRREARPPNAAVPG